MSALGRQIISAVRAKAADRPDYIYLAVNENGSGKCTYWNDDGTPSCLVGWALYLTGIYVPLDMNDEAFNMVADALKLPLDHNEIEWLSRVQHWQDRAQRWSTAVRFADEEVTLEQET